MDQWIRFSSIFSQMSYKKAVLKIFTKFALKHQGPTWIAVVKIHPLVTLCWVNNPANICWSWRRLHHVFSVRHLEDILQDVLKTSWKTKNCYAEDVLKTCLEDVLKTCLEDVLKTCPEDVLKTLWRQANYLLGISVSIKSKCLSNKSIFNKSTFGNSKANPKCIK